MADKNHVRTLVHATGRTMTWAMEYYKAYRFELSKQESDDMIIDEVVDVTGGNPKTAITFVDVLDRILDAANAGYSELMIVAHGSPKGLIMPMAPGLGSADKEGLPLMTELARILLERDRIRAVKDAKKQLAEWIKLLRGLSGAAVAGVTWGSIPSAALDGLGSSDGAEKLLESTSPTVKGGGAMLKNKTVLNLLGLRNQVVRKKLKRVEVRACNLGQDSDGMEALRVFLGCATVLAPMVKTFYANVNPVIFTKDADYKRWLAAHVPWRLKLAKDPPLNRTYIGDDLFISLSDKHPTPLAVLKLVQPRFETCATLASPKLKYRAIKILVEENIDVKRKSGYQSGRFFVGGLDPIEGRTKTNPPPAAAHGKAFLLPSEPEYRAMIVANP